MSIALVQQVAGQPGNGSPKSITIATPGAGNALRLMITRPFATSITGITGGGVTWSRLGSVVNNSNSTWSVEIWGGDNSSGSGTTISVSVGNNYTTFDYNFSEWSGLDTTPVADPSPSGNTSTSSTAATSSVTPTAGKEVLLLACTRFAAIVTNSPSGGFTALTRTVTSEGYAYQIVASASGSYSTTWALNVGYNPWATIIAGWDAAGGGGATYQPYDLAHQPQHQTIMAM